MNAQPQLSLTAALIAILLSTPHPYSAAAHLSFPVSFLLFLTDLDIDGSVTSFLGGQSKGLVVDVGVIQMFQEYVHT